MKPVALLSLIVLILVLGYFDYQSQKVNKRVVENVVPIVVHPSKKTYDETKFETAHKRTLTEE